MKDKKAKVSDFKIFNDIEWIDPKMPHSWQNVRLELVSAKLEMYVKLRLGACYNCFPQDYKCLLAIFITTLLKKNR